MVVVVDLAGRSHFFVGAAVGLAIGRAVSIETDVAVGFSGLSLW